MAFNFLQNLIKPASDAFQKRAEKKMHEKTLEAKIAEKRMDTEAQIEFNQQEWEMLALWANESTWKDELITIVVLSPFMLILIGGVLSAFGMPEVLNGVELALQRMENLGLNLGRMIEVVAYAGVGVYSFGKILK